VSEKVQSRPCIGCGAIVPDIDGPNFRYPHAASPGCWAIYGEVLAWEYSALLPGGIHRLSVDCYAVQHPGSPTPQTIQSVNVHLLGLRCILERGYDFSRTTEMMSRATRMFKGHLEWLEPPPSKGDVTVLDVADAVDPEVHARLVRRWADSAWQAWSAHHEVIRGLAKRLEGKVRTIR